MRYSLSLVALASVVTLSCAIGFQNSSAEPGASTGELSTASSSTSGETAEPTGESLERAEQRVELGTVDWLRDFEQAKARAREIEKPMFVLFTEVPGCATVRGFGREVLSDPIVADAIESDFVPVAVFNNVEGEDRRVLNSFDEPTWNNPVVRIVHPDRTALADRFAGPYHTEALLETIGTALEEVRGDVPEYLTLRQREVASRSHRKKAIFDMYCFWSGEAGLGRLEGVVRTRPGFMAGTEVVRVTYDGRRTSYEALLEAVQSSGAASGAFVRTGARLETAESVFGDNARLVDDDFRVADDDRKYYLRRSKWRTVEMTELQRTRVNSALKHGGSPAEYLSPQQRATVE